ncbi:hypothetical protein LTR35_016048 [Friedmanniomyces endolithicus]|uniref:Uncharacterized protein n=1 Tax=Friedmanniomyces endolithicus TaxID=329885 RepID=A0AAN6FFI3_9PEZI|nr:hypothetical protein LTR35_016048 [Friedmanniomyces endolithicus]KAK0280636.1 hypothetical protein LTS00_012878 [Friedmanniomyces endolithicus]KAK0317500.1 hypothetical protein LTR82_011539 [Friedmanniomyces endolithicus]
MSGEDDTVTDARSEHRKAMIESGLDQSERDEGNMADDEDAEMCSGKTQDKKRSVDLPKASVGEGISGLNLKAMTTSTRQLSDEQALLDEEIAWQQTIQQQLRAEGMSDLGDHVAVKQQALEEQRSQMRTSPPVPDHMASQPASSSPAAAQLSTQRSAPEQQIRPEHTTSEATMPSEPNTLTAPPVKQQCYDFNRLARKIQTSNLRGISASAAASTTLSPPPTFPLNDPHAATLRPQANSVDELLSISDPPPAPPIPPRSPRRPGEAKDHITPYPTGNESGTSIRQHEMESAVAGQQQQQQQGTFERVSLSLPGAESGGTGAGGHGGGNGGIAEMAPQGVRTREYEFGTLLDERREYWILFSVGQLEGMVRSAEMQGRESGRGGGEMVDADVEWDGVAIGAVRYLGES